MLVLNPNIYPVVTIADGLPIGQVVYWQKQSPGTPVGLLLTLTSSGSYKKAIVTSGGLVSIT